MGSHRHPKGGLLWAQSPLPDFIQFFFPSCWVVLSRSGNCSILQVTGLENIKTTLSSLFINISADALCLQLSAVSNRRGRVEARLFWRAVLNSGSPADGSCAETHGDRGTVAGFWVGMAVPPGFGGAVWMNACPALSDPQKKKCSTL